MGNRAVIAIQQDETDENNFVLLYGHHSGGDNLNAVLETMKRTSRIGDPAYLTAQIFYEFARFGDYNGELGFGIYTGGREAIDETDNPAVFVNPYNGVITYQGRTLDTLNFFYKNDATAKRNFISDFSKITSVSKDAAQILTR